MEPIEQQVEARLLCLRDEAFQAFQCRLIPTLPPSAILGVRTPELHRLARELSRTQNAARFCQCLPHRYYEENTLHGFLLHEIRAYEPCLAALNAFLPYVDNWATCDLTNPPALQARLPALLLQVRAWLHSSHPYTVRFGMETLLRFYLEDAVFDPSSLSLVAEVQTDAYYVNMMAAWYFATALAKQYEAALPYLEQHRLGCWVHNKAIQKATESRRLSAEQKSYLRTLKEKCP